MRHLLKGFILLECLLLIIPSVVFADSEVAINDDSGNILEDTVWRDGTYRLTSDIQIKHGVTLTICDGAVVEGNGYSIKTFGSLVIEGSELNNVHINACNTGDNPCSITMIESRMNGGSLLNPTGNSGHAYIHLEGNYFKSLNGYLYIWYPNNEIVIAKNIFSESGGLSIGSHYNVYIECNLFHDMTTDFIIQDWAQYDDSQCIVRHNSFYDKRSVLSLKYDSGSMNASDNYWDGLYESEVQQRIVDGRVDFSIANTIGFSPILKEPYIWTPSIDLIDPEGIPGDVNMDTKVNFQDVTTLLKHVKKKPLDKVDLKAVDVDGNGKVNF